MSVAVYKFLDSEHVSSVIAGTFRLGSARFYRMLERATGDTAVGDKTEGRRENHLLLDLHTRDQSLTSMEAISSELEKLGIGLPPTFAGELGEFSFDVTFVRDLPCFLLSLSVGPLDAIRAHFTDDPAGPSYGGCVKFSDAAELARLIETNGVVKLESGDVAVTDFCEAVVFAPVVYSDVKPYKFGSGPLDPNPLIKPPSHKGQQEFRIVLVPKEKVGLPDGIFVECLAAAELATIEYSEPRTKPSPAKVHVHDDLRRIFELYEKLQLTHAVVEARRQVAGWDDRVDFAERRRREAPLRTGEALIAEEICRALVPAYWRLRGVLGASRDMDHVVDGSCGSLWILANRVRDFLRSNRDLVQSALSEGEG